MNGLGVDLARIFTVEGAAWTVTGAFCLLVARIWTGAPGMFAQWVAYRRSKTEERAGDWSRLRDENQRLDARCQRLEERIDQLENNEERCREELSAANARLAALEGYQLGHGKARQDAANIVAIERLEKEQ